MIPQIDLTRQHAALAEDLLAATARVLASSRFILGPEVRLLEEELAASEGARHGIGVASGTDALLLALKAVGVGPGDEVVTSAFSFVASASTVLLIGATPVFADIDEETYNLDPARLEAAITPRTRAIVPVHLYGQPAPMDEIEAIARRHGVAVVADAAQAVGASYGGRPIAAWGDVSTLSFYPTKNLGGCGDGGMVLTARDDVAARVRLLRDHGAPQKYFHVELGYSSRLDELQAALLRVKLRHLPAWTAARRRLAARYLDGLRDTGLVLPVERPPAQHVFHQFAVRSVKRESLIRGLAELGVGTSVHYPTILPCQPLFSGPAAARDFPVAARASAEMVGLPCFPEMTDTEIDAVVSATRQAAAALG